MKRLEHHAFSKFLPKMSAAEYEATKADVIRKGHFIEPGKLYQGKILDGRHRDQISHETGIPMKWEKFNVEGKSTVTDADALEYVYSKALHRNMTDSQKAASAVLMLPHFAAEAKDRMA